MSAQKYNPLLVSDHFLENDYFPAYSPYKYVWNSPLSGRSSCLGREGGVACRLRLGIQFITQKRDSLDFSLTVEYLILLIVSSELGHGICLFLFAVTNVVFS